MSRNFCFVSSVINKSFLTIVKDLSLYFEKKNVIDNISKFRQNSIKASSYSDIRLIRN